MSGAGISSSELSKAAFEQVEARPEDVAVLDPVLKGVFGSDRNVAKRRDTLAVASKVQIDLAAGSSCKRKAGAGKELLKAVFPEMLRFPRLDEHDLSSADPGEVARHGAVRSGKPDHLARGNLINLNFAGPQVPL